MWGRQETALGAGDVVPTGPREALARDTWGAGDSSEPAPLARGPHGWEAVCAWHAVCLSVVMRLEGAPSYLPNPWGTASGPRGSCSPCPGPSGTHGLPEHPRGLAPALPVHAEVLRRGRGPSLPGDGRAHRAPPPLACGLTSPAPPSPNQDHQRPGRGPRRSEDAAGLPAPADRGCA